MSPSDIDERKVVSRWQAQMESRRRLVTTDGHAVEVIYPGRVNDSRGGDFRDAVIIYGREMKQGCIEVHSRISDWEAHGHHKDPQYNQVVLHVAWGQDASGPIRLENGQRVPTVVLDRDLAALENSGEVLPCRSALSADLESRLDKMGEERLAEKTERFRRDLMKSEAEQVLYVGVMESLGYSKNKRPFLELARRVSLRDLELMIDSGRDRITLEAYLLGSAGLLPSQRGLDINGEEYIRDLETAWKTSASSRTMSYHDWELYKVRPGSYPVRRIIVASSLVFRYRYCDWLGTWLPVLRKWPKNGVSEDPGSLLKVRAESYWANHFDFTVCQSKCGSWLLGKERANEITINVILPFFIAWGRLQGEVNLLQSLENRYRQYPVSEMNAIQKHMLSQLRLEKENVNSALRQQGLLHLYKAYCTQGRCVECL